MVRNKGPALAEDPGTEQSRAGTTSPMCRYLIAPRARQAGKQRVQIGSWAVSPRSTSSRPWAPAIATIEETLPKPHLLRARQGPDLHPPGPRLGPTGCRPGGRVGDARHRHRLARRRDRRPDRDRQDRLQCVSERLGPPHRSCRSSTDVQRFVPEWSDLRQFGNRERRDRRRACPSNSRGTYGRAGRL